MSDWQKIRVSFVDADGKDVSAVMWQSDSNDWLRVNPELDSDGPIMMVSGMRWEPIRELPTGVGAVIRVSNYGVGEEPQNDDLNIWVKSVDHHWGNRDGDWAEPGDEWQFEVLSEGIVL